MKCEKTVIIPPNCDLIKLRKAQFFGCISENVTIETELNAYRVDAILKYEFTTKNKPAMSYSGEMLAYRFCITGIGKMVVETISLEDTPINFSAFLPIRVYGLFLSVKLGMDVF